MRMIENVVALRPQFDVESLGNLGSLGEGRIKIHKTRSIEVVAANTSRPIKQGRGKIIASTGERSGVGEPDLVAP